MFPEMLIRCRALAMAGLKTGNMFNCPFVSKEEMTAELRRLNQVPGPKGFRIPPLRRNGGSAPVYIFRPKMPEKDLQGSPAVCTRQTLYGKLSAALPAGIFTGKADGHGLKLAVLVPAREWNRPQKERMNLRS